MTTTSTVIELTDRNHDDFVASPSQPKDVSYASRFSSLASNTKDNLVSLPRNENDIPSMNQEFKLPSRRSLFIIIGGNCIFQLSFFIIVSSASVYAERLGGSEVFSGLTIGIPTFISGITLFFVTQHDKGRYTMPLTISYASMILGNIIYALAYRANFLYLILIGRMVSGVGFIAFMYSKRYCSDPRIVGIRRRTTLASWLVLGQGFGFSAGPFVGGLLFKLGFKSRIFNGVTSPGWIMAIVWTCFGLLSSALFEDIPRKTCHRVQSNRVARTTSESDDPISSPTSESATRELPSLRTLNVHQWGVIACMCYYAMTCFLILGAWEANIPIFTARTLGYSPFRAGNFIALGGLVSIPFLLLNVRYARRFQDRVILATGTTLGLVGLVVMVIILKTDSVTSGSLFVCWALIALGFNLATTCTLSLLSKQLPDVWNSKMSVAIQYSNYTGRVTGAILGGAGVKIGMINYIGIQIAVVGIGGLMYLSLWKSLKAKTG